MFWSKLCILCFHHFGLLFYSAHTGLHSCSQLSSVFLSSSSEPYYTTIPFALSSPFFSHLSPPLSVLCLLLHYHHSPSVALWGETQPSVLLSITQSLSILHSLTSKWQGHAVTRTLSYTWFLLHVNSAFFPRICFLFSLYFNHPYFHVLLLRALGDQSVITITADINASETHWSFNNPNNLEVITNAFGHINKQVPLQCITYPCIDNVNEYKFLCTYSIK